MPFYECVLIARQDISSNQVEGLVGQFSKIIEDGGGRVAKTEMWGLRNLAYRIKKNRKGHYTLLNLDAPAAAIAEMERNMRLSEDVIRYLTTRVNTLEEGPSIVMQSKHSRDERGGRGGRGGFRGDRRGEHTRHGGGPRAPEAAKADNETTDKKDGKILSTPDKKAESELEAKTVAKPESGPEPEAKAKPEPGPEPEAKAKPEPGPEPEAKAEDKESGQ